MELCHKPGLFRRGPVDGNGIADMLRATQRIMIYGDNKILKIPFSGKLVKIETLISGNTCGARHWSDGKAEYPMFPERLWLRVHPDGRELFWLDECETIARENPAKKPGKHANVPFSETPNLDDYRRALESAIFGNEEEERYIRTHFWWTANDPVRHHQPDAQLPGDFRENLMKLQTMLNPAEPNDRITASEIARELGDFDAAIRLLDFPFPRKLSYYVRKFKEWSGEKDTSVREMRDDR